LKHPQRLAFDLASCCAGGRDCSPRVGIQDVLRIGVARRCLFKHSSRSFPIGLKTMADEIGRRKRILFSGLIMGITLTMLFVILKFGLGRYNSMQESATLSQFHATCGWALKPGQYR
jgi:hypothetical protein